MKLVERGIPPVVGVTPSVPPIEGLLLRQEEDVGDDVHVLPLGIEETHAGFGGVQPLLSLVLHVTQEPPSQNEVERKLAQSESSEQVVHEKVEQEDIEHFGADGALQPALAHKPHVPLLQ